MSRKTEESATARFKVGDKVRVKCGVINLKFPDFPLGGCSGTVTEIVGQKKGLCKEKTTHVRQQANSQ
jgi:hypothetical protein